MFNTKCKNTENEDIFDEIIIISNNCKYFASHNKRFCVLSYIPRSFAQKNEMQSSRITLISFLKFARESLEPARRSAMDPSNEL